MMTDEQRLHMITEQLLIVRDNLFRGMSKSMQKLQAKSINEVLELPNFIESPQRTAAVGEDTKAWVGLTDEEMKFLATAIGQAQQIIDTHNAEFVTARDDLRRCAELLAAQGIKVEA